MCAKGSQEIISKNCQTERNFPQLFQTVDYFRGRSKHGKKKVGLSVAPI